MKRTVLALGLAALAPWVGACSAPADGAVGDVASPIVNGTVDNGDPAVVFLWLGSGSCSGTLVSPHVVLTAQHCVAGVWASDMQVFFGTNVDDNGTWIQVVDADAHPSGDIAAVTLADAGPTAPIPLADHAFVSGDEGTPVRIAGFGVTSEWGSDSGLKREGTSQLDSWDSEFLYIGGGQSDTCYGDSGGPAFIEQGGVEQVAGVTSFGTAECGYGLSGETRVDVFHQWVVDYIQAADPASCGADGLCAQGCAQADPDCPCAGDGFCTAACGAPATDPDCAGCEPNGVCRADCPTVDSDCCGADGSCDPACGSTDPDCGGTGDGGSGHENGTGAGPDFGGDGGDDGSSGDPADSDDASGDAGGCATAPERPGHGHALGALVLLALSFAARRRR